jgi:hypothetical protein
MHITARSYYLADDWKVTRQAGSLGGLFKPYNDHLSFVILGVYRVIVELFAFDYTPARLVGFAVLFAVPLAYFATARRQLGAFVAALLALPLIWYGRYIDLFAGAFNHYLALLGGIACAAALNHDRRDRRADWALGGALVLSLCSAGGGVAVAAGCVVHNLCTRAPWRRWFAVLAPSFLWVAWWLTSESSSSKSLGPDQQSTAHVLTFVRNLAYTPFESIALGVAWIAMALVGLYIVYGLWTLSKGLRNGANWIAWSVALVVWGYGVATDRTGLASVTVFRYRYVALGIALLAVVPRERLVWPARIPFGADRRALAVATVIVIALGSARAFAVRSDMSASAKQYAAFGQTTRGTAMVVELGPSVIANDVTMPFLLGGPLFAPDPKRADAGDSAVQNLDAGDIRRLFARYGSPTDTTAATIDRQLVEHGIVYSVGAGSLAGAHCSALEAPFRYRSASGGLYLWSRGEFTVDVRRFGDKWVRVGSGRPGQVVSVVLPSLDATRAWGVRAIGACRVPRP